MLRKQIYWMLLLILSGLMSCGDDDGIGPVDKVNLLRFDFPQGNDPWDKEIEQIAKEWGMYIIYKDVDSTHLNRMWTSPSYYEPIYVCKTPGAEDIQMYLKLVKEWLLTGLDKNKESDRKQLPCYLYLVNDFKDNNKDSRTYGRHIQLKQDGMDYWSLSFTSEQLAVGLTSKQIHGVACAFSYPAIKSRFLSGEYVMAPTFSVETDYERPIGQRYYSLEAWKKENPGAPDFFYTDHLTVHPSEQDPENAYLRRGFAPQVSEAFELVKSNFGAPTWMPWIVQIMSFPGWDDIIVDRNPGPVASSVDERILQDFLNTIRVAMIYPEEKIRELFPVNTGDPLEKNGYQIINDKYDVVVDYMKTTYGMDLQKFPTILDE